MFFGYCHTRTNTNESWNLLQTTSNIISSIDHSDLHQTTHWSIYDDTKQNHYFVNAIPFNAHHHLYLSPFCINQYTHIKKYYFTSRKPPLQMLCGQQHQWFSNYLRNYYVGIRYHIWNYLSQRLHLLNWRHTTTMSECHQHFSTQRYCHDSIHHP